MSSTLTPGTTVRIVNPTTDGKDLFQIESRYTADLYCVIEGDIEADEYTHVSMVRLTGETDGTHALATMVSE